MLRPVATGSDYIQTDSLPLVAHALGMPSLLDKQPSSAVREFAECVDLSSESTEVGIGSSRLSHFEMANDWGDPRCQYEGHRVGIDHHTPSAPKIQVPIALVLDGDTHLVDPAFQSLLAAMSMCCLIVEKSPDRRRHIPVGSQIYSNLRGYLMYHWALGRVHR